MENLILFLATTLVIRFSSSKKAKLQYIGDTGCSALLSDNKLDSNLTQTGDRLYFQEFKDSGVSYGMICVQMNDQFELYEAEEMLRSYIDKLKGLFTYFTIQAFTMMPTGILKQQELLLTTGRTAIKKTGR